MCSRNLALCRSNFLAKFRQFTVEVGFMFRRLASNLIAFLIMNSGMVRMKDASLHLALFFLFDATGNHEATLTPWCRVYC
jgi:hypothetical protein